MWGGCGWRRPESATQVAPERNTEEAGGAGEEKERSPRRWGERGRRARAKETTGPGARAKTPLREVHGWGLNGYLGGTPRNVVPGRRHAGWFHTGRDSERDTPMFREGGPAS